MTLRWRRQLVVDLRPGIDGEEWDELLDRIIAELSNADRVRFLVPDLTAVEQQLRTTPVDVLRKRGIEVEQRRMR